MSIFPEVVALLNIDWPKQTGTRALPFWGHNLKSGSLGLYSLHGLQGSVLLASSASGVSWDSSSIFMWALLHPHRTSLA